MELEYIIKRDGRTVPFDSNKIEMALAKCYINSNLLPNTSLPELTEKVVKVLQARTGLPTVEQVQDTVEIILQSAGEYQAAKEYILYRDKQTQKRLLRPVPEEVKAAFDLSAEYFPTPLQQFQFFDKYSRFDYTKGRRETWVETVNRAVDFLYELGGDAFDSSVYQRIRQAILEMKVMPSMRLLAMAGPAARRSHITTYNCSYQPVDSIDAFVEALVISMSGCGVGFSVEREYVEKLPRIVRPTGKSIGTHTIEDSAEGWVVALRLGLETWFSGGDVTFDYSQLRPSGAPLKIKGGRASGPEPLRAMLNFVKTRIQKRAGSFLRTLDAHDLMCVVGNAAVSGGMRRTAMISLFDYDNLEMRNAKSGDFERENSQRWNANNSAVWLDGGITQLEIMEQVMDMFKSGRGEPGIFNRQAAWDMLPERRKRRDEDGNLIKFGPNPLTCLAA
jgi:ribonucleoside-triphosphate reductase (thioredoxin)